MPETITSNGITATRNTSTGSWVISRNAAANMPQITLNSTNANEISRALQIIAAAPPNLRTALTSYYNTNQVINFDLTLRDTPGESGHSEFAGPTATNLYAPANPQAAGNTTTSINVVISRSNFYDYTPDDPKARFLDAKFTEFVIHELLHPYAGQHIWTKYDPATNSYYNDRTDANVANDPTSNLTFEDLLSLGIAPSGANGTGAQLLDSYRARVKSFIAISINRNDASNKLLLPKIIYTREDSSKYQAASQLGAAIGSTIGRYLVNDNIVASTVAGSVFGTIGQNLAQFLTTNGLSGKIINLSDQTVSVLDNFGYELGQNLKNAAIGAVSSALFMELGRTLGVSGFGAELLSNTGSTILGKVIDNLATNPSGNLFNGLDSTGLFGKTSNGIAKGGLLPGAIGSFLGSKLGSLILAPNNTEGAILSSLGATGGVIALTTGASALGIGSFTTALTQFFGGVANIGVPFVGSLVGFLLGSLIGRLFGSKKPRTPTASAEAFLDLSSGRWALGAMTSANGGNVDFAKRMANSAVDAVNGLINYVVGGSDLNAAGNAVALREKFGHQGNTVYFDWYSSGSWVRAYSGSDSSVATEMGVSYALRETRVRGGDFLVKRLIAAQPNASLTTLLGNVQVAEDYRKYLTNAANINGAIAADPSSTFAAGWIVTLLQAEELGLNRFSASDFYGGLQGFAESFGFGRVNPLGELGSGYENLVVSIEGAALRIAATDGTSPFDLLTGSNNVTGATAGQSALVPDFQSAIGYTNWTGQATAGNDIWVAGGDGPVTMDDIGTQYYGYWDPYYGYYQYPVTVSGGDDIFVGSSYSDTIYGRSGWDWLDGGAGNDLIDGGDNDDVLLGRDGNDRMVGGSGDDYIAGGDGDDYFYDANQTWGLYGGDGNDILVGGAGSDSSYGENGNDIIIVDQDGGYTWDAVNGQDGSDTISYERFSGGVYVDFSILGGWSWDPSAKYIYGDAISGVENVTGSRFDDIILGDSGGNVLRGLVGADTLYGRDGDDILEGGTGADALVGDGGRDTASYEHSKDWVYVDLQSGTTSGGDAIGDTFSSIENLTGSRFDDDLRGDASDNSLRGLDGDDYFAMSEGFDTIEGGAGLDTFDGSAASGPLTIYYDPGYYYEYDPYYGYPYQVYTGPAGTYASSPTATSALDGIEYFIGSAWNDSVAGSDADEVFEGRGGNDYLYGGTGSDTYVLGRGDGADSVSDDSSSMNSLRLGAGINWRDVAIYGADYSQQSGTLTVSIRGTSDQIAVGNNFSYVNTGNDAGNHNHVIKTINLAGLSTLDIDMVDFTPYAADDNSTVVYGAQNRSDLIFAYAGDDTIYTAGNSYNYEYRGNVVYAGDGYDMIYASYGDDQFIYERGNGVDVIFESGGTDTIVMGPSVAADDVVYEVIKTFGNGDYGSDADLYIGIRDPDRPNVPVYQLNDYIRIASGGIKLVGMNSGAEQLNTIEHIRVGGQEIDLTKANIDWAVSYYYDGGYYPIALDLDGDGIELRSVEGSRITTVESDGTVTRMGWLGQDDGFLALDRDANGVIDRIGEISFIGDKEGAKTDLEGLAAYDSNGDGKLDASDARWGEFKVWQDKNQDGFGSEKELIGLDEAGVSSINLKGQLTGFTAADGPDNTVIATTDVVWKDTSRTGSAYDVMLARLQVRTDGGAKDVVELQGKKADDIEAKLRGIQALTAEQAAAIKDKKSKQADTGGEGGRFYRVEDLLEGGSANVEDGLYSIAHNLAKSVAGAGRELGALDRFAESEWTKLGSTTLGEADIRGTDVPFQKMELTDRQKGVIDDARKIVADRAAADHAKGSERAAKDAVDAVLRPAPTPPSAQELKHLKQKDQFELLEGAADTVTGTRKIAPAGSMARTTAFDDNAPTPVEELETARQPAAEPVETGQRKSKPETTSQGSAPEEQRAEADVYGVVIRAANARLVQALATFGDAPAMMANYQGLNAANDAQAAWLSVDAMPSVQRLASIR